MSRHLHVSLGHNSSAVLVEDGVVVRGYEQERLSGVKGDSAYPRDAIDLALAGERADIAFVTHWFNFVNDHEPLNESNKYFDRSHLVAASKSLITHSREFTHHDAHAQSALSWAHSNGVSLPRDGAHIVVLDGFGNNYECASIYHTNSIDDEYPMLLHRTYGYELSLGLMYQYATEYLGMRPLQDEYKLLGYESHVTDCVSIACIDRVYDFIRRAAAKHARAMRMGESQPLHVDLIDKDALKRTRARWFETFDLWYRQFTGWYRKDEFSKRACVAFAVQTFLEECVVDYLTHVLPDSAVFDIILTGGVAYNVKLSRAVATSGLAHRVMSHPLAGDQGAALGFTRYQAPDDLSWGERRVSEMGYSAYPPDGVIHVREHEFPEVAAKLLQNGTIVNVIRGAMEYGPRALCNTTTFALPTSVNAARINLMNARSEVMPMAPVITREASRLLFDTRELDAIGPSERYMISTVAFKVRPDESLMGVAHPHPTKRLWTARPQVVYPGDPIHDLLNLVPNGTLINTSFNYHGEPIIYRASSAYVTHTMQTKNALASGFSIAPPITLIVRG